jgi:simple sugar transport system permease protein
MSVEADITPTRTSGFGHLGDRINRALRRYAIFLILAALIILFNAAEPAFLRVNNLFSVLQSVAVVALLGIGVTMTLAVDGFDLSVGSIASFTLMLSSYAMVVLQLDAVETVALALLAGASIGLINGLLIIGLRIPDLLATLGMMFLLAGLQLIPSAGRSITIGLSLPDGSVAGGSFDPNFLAIGRYKLWDVVPLPVIIVSVLAIAFWILMERTRWGRVFYAVGGNETAAHLAGAPVKAYRLAAYVISGTLASLGGVFEAARVGRGDVFAGSPCCLTAWRPLSSVLPCSTSATPTSSARSRERSLSASSSTV